MLVVYICATAAFLHLQRKKVEHAKLKEAMAPKNTHRVSYVEKYKTILPLKISVLSQMVLSAVLH